MSEAGTKRILGAAPTSPSRRAGQVKRIARLIAREPFPEAHLGGTGVLRRQFRSGFLRGARPGALGAAGLLLTVVFVGVVVLAGGLRAARGLGAWQLGLARGVLGDQIEGPEPFTARPGFFGWLRASLGDQAAWRAVGYFVAKVPFTIFGT